MSYNPFYEGGFYDKGTGAQTPVSAAFLNQLEAFLSAIPEFQTGRTESERINPHNNAPADYTITFPEPFSGVPAVMLTLDVPSTNSNYGGVEASVVSISTTQCTIRVYNNTASNLYPRYRWLAVYIPGGDS